MAEISEFCSYVDAETPDWVIETASVLLGFSGVLVSLARFLDPQFMAMLRKRSHASLRRAATVIT